MPKLTKRLVDAAKPGPKPEFVWDEALPGFGLLVNPTGKKVYVAQYRNAAGRTRRISLGQHGVLTPDQARSIASAELALARAGGDPADDRKKARLSLTVAHLADRYIHEHLPKKKDSSAREDRRILHTYVLPTLGARQLEDVTAKDIAKLHLSMKSTCPSRKPTSVSCGP